MFSGISGTFPTSGTSFMVIRVIDPLIELGDKYMIRLSIKSCIFHLRTYSILDHQSGPQTQDAFALAELGGCSLSARRITSEHFLQ